MDIGAFQKWFAAYDKERSLDLVETSQVAVHLMEEAGEIAREVLYLEGYRNPDDRVDAASRLSGEIGDAIVFLTKIAQHYGIDLDTVMHDIVTKAESRWPLTEAEHEMARYMEHTQAAQGERVAAWRLRHRATEDAASGCPSG